MLVLRTRRASRAAQYRGLAKSTLRIAAETYLRAGPTNSDWREPRTLSRMVFLFLPRVLALSPEVGRSGLRRAAGILRGQCINGAALKVSALIERRLRLSTLPQHSGCAGHELGKSIPAFAARRATNGSLAAWQRRKSVAYIEEHLAEPISLAALTRLVG
jgi:hypothetical protein